MTRPYLQGEVSWGCNVAAASAGSGGQWRQRRRWPRRRRLGPAMGSIGVTSDS